MRMQSCFIAPFLHSTWSHFSFNFLIIVALACLASLPVSARSAPEQAYDRDEALAISQGALNNKLSGHKLFDVSGEEVNLEDYRGKPLLVSMIFTSCHHICPTLTRNLASVVEIAREALGEDSFSVITVGFDTAVDTPERMRTFAAEQNVVISNWDFLSADSETISALSEDLGFIFFPTPRGFDHLTQLSVIDAEGSVYRQIYGVKFDTPAVVEPLKELVFGKRSEAGLVEGWLNNVRLFCTVYDPHSGRYQFDYSIFIGMALGVLVLGGIAAFIYREWRHPGAGRAS